MLRLCFGPSWIPWTKRKSGRLGAGGCSTRGFTLKHCWYLQALYSIFNISGIHCVQNPMPNLFTYTEQFLHKLQACLSMACHVLSHWRWASAQSLLHRLLWRLCWTKRTKVIPLLKLSGICCRLVPNVPLLIDMHFTVTENQRQLDFFFKFGKMLSFEGILQTHSGLCK